MKYRYRKDLKLKARSLRKNLTDAEKKLWRNLRGRQLLGYQFYRQRPLGKYIVDFYCPKAQLVIELDGDQHYFPKGKGYDKKRTKILNENFKLKVIRFSNLDVLNNMEGVVRAILAELKIPLSPPLKKGER